ncbi:MAG: methyltransferase domain-containing protein [Bryobacteraceae bacterium]
MSLAEWDERHRAADDVNRRSERAASPRPTPVLSQAVESLPPGNALDLACGRGEDALWLAQNGWSVTAVDGSPAAIGILTRDAQQLNLRIQTHIANLEAHEFSIAAGEWDLIVICKYFQPDLYERAIPGLTPGGVMVATALLAAPGKHQHRVAHGQFTSYFEGLEILHSEETKGAHPIAEIVARRVVA